MTLSAVHNPASMVFAGNRFDLGLTAFNYSEGLALRAGYDHGSNPIGSRDVTFNILAPGVTTDHVTLGLTHTNARGSELTLSLTHAFNSMLTGTSLLPAFMGQAPAGSESIQMHQNSVGMAFGHAF